MARIAVKQGSAKTLLDAKVLVPGSGPVLSMFIHKEQDLVQHHLQLTRVFKPCQPTSARQQIPDGKIHGLVKPGPGLVHSINCLLVGDVGLSRSEIVLQFVSLLKAMVSAQYKLKTQSEERTTLIRFMQIRPANHRSRRSHVLPQTQGIGGYPPTTPTHGRRLDTIIPCV